MNFALAGVYPQGSLQLSHKFGWALWYFTASAIFQGSGLQVISQNCLVAQALDTTVSNKLVANSTNISDFPAQTLARVVAPTAERHRNRCFTRMKQLPANVQCPQLMTHARLIH